MITRRRTYSAIAFGAMLAALMALGAGVMLNALPLCALAVVMVGVSIVAALCDTPAPWGRHE